MEFTSAKPRRPLVSLPSLFPRLMGEKSGQGEKYGRERGTDTDKRRWTSVYRETCEAHTEKERRRGLCLSEKHELNTRGTDSAKVDCSQIGMDMRRRL